MSTVASSVPLASSAVDRSDAALYPRGSEQTLNRRQWAPGPIGHTGHDRIVSTVSIVRCRFGRTVFRGDREYEAEAQRPSD